MLLKKYRLTEREVKKVLSRGKPFFSYSLVFKKFPSKLPHGRFAIVISGKSAKNAIIRNVYRRSFYNIVREKHIDLQDDIVCIISSKVKLDTSPEALKRIQSEWKYILDKKIGKNT